MAKYNDLDMKRCKEYEDISTDTLWIIDRRDNSGAHSGKYHGNFVPQIPNQLFRRYTKKGDWVPAKPTKLQIFQIIIQTAEHSNIPMSFCYTKSNILKNIRDLTTKNPTLSPSKLCLPE